MGTKGFACQRSHCRDAILFAELIKHSRLENVPEGQSLDTVSESEREWVPLDVAKRCQAIFT